jgi:hypothetical protein
LSFLSSQTTFDEIEKKWKEILHGQVSSTLKDSISKDTTTISNCGKETFASPAAGTVNDKASQGLILEIESDAYRIPNGSLEEDKDASSKMVSLDKSNINLLSSSGHGAAVTVDSGDEQIEHGNENLFSSLTDMQHPTCSIQKSNLSNESHTLSPVHEMNIPFDQTSENAFHATCPIDPKVLHMLSNICTISPVNSRRTGSTSLTSDITIAEEAKKIPAEWNASFNAPFITIHPSYVSSISGEDLLSALDEAIASAFPHKSIHEPELYTFIPSELPRKITLIDALQTFAFTKASEHEFSLQETERHESLLIPLYMLIILRFRLALISAFLSKNIEDHDRVLGFHNRLSPSEEILSTLCFVKELRLIQEKNPLLANEIFSKLSMKLPEIAEQIKCDDENRVQDFLMPPLGVITGLLLQSREPRWNIIQSINEEVLASVTMAFEEGRGAAAFGADSESVSVGLEGFLVSPDGPHKSSERLSDHVNVIGGKKAKRKKKKKVSHKV